MEFVTRASVCIPCKIRIWPAIGGGRRTWRSTRGRTPAASGCFSQPRGRRCCRDPHFQPLVPLNAPQSLDSVDDARLPIRSLSSLSQQPFIPLPAPSSYCRASERPTPVPIKAGEVPFLLPIFQEEKFWYYQSIAPLPVAAEGEVLPRRVCTRRRLRNRSVRWGPCPGCPCPRSTPGPVHSAILKGRKDWPAASGSATVAIINDQGEVRPVQFIYFLDPTGSKF